MSPNDFTSEEKEILLIALNNLQNVVLELDKIKASRPENISTALKEIDILKDKIANGN